MAARVSREFRAGRRAFARSVSTSLKALIRGTPWRMAKGVLFRDFQGWFVSAGSSIWPLEAKTSVNFRFKPMGLDPLFWQIVGLPENEQLPLSFRYWGAWTCSTPVWAEMEFADSEKGPAQIAARIVDSADAQLQRATPHLSHDAFLGFVENYPSQRSGRHFVATLTVTLLLMSRDEDALEVLREARTAKHDGEFLMPAGSFVDVAIDWIKNRSGKDQVH